ncbi:MAG: PHP domain-containing protein [Rhabdochlamydiaceae bacterium]|nr:PHP domain-containing protein [Rhabdochlamydiaceae bacterium]
MNWKSDVSLTDKTSQFRADLHCHSTCSDGTFSPVELISHAKQIGLKGLSITDHDTVEAYKTAIPAAKEQGILLGTGVEFSCIFKQWSIHILGYDFLIDDPGILNLCAQHQHRRLKRNQAILDVLAKLRMPISEEELRAKGEDSIGRPHIAQLMVDKGYVSSIREAFQQYLGDGKRAFVSGDPFSIPETIDIIHQAQGKAFLAHPHLINRNHLIKELLRLPFDGIECYYGRFLADQEKRWVKLAQEKNLLKSGGSDFHGDIKAYVPLGSSWVDESSFRVIFEKI